ncbi:hypothetical protein ACWCP6_29880 [Streptomyces sp. NPDC002004]
MGDRSGAAVRLARGAPLGDVLDVTDVDDWIALDADVREVDWYRSGELSEWEHTDPLPVDLTQLGESRLALALCHRDGRIRETAVRLSTRYPALLPLVVIRCTDWAGPVRERARELLRASLDVDTAAGLAPLVLCVGRRERGSFGVALLGEVLHGAPLGRLSALFTDPDRAVRRFAFRVAIKRQLLSPAELARAANRDDDSVVQDLCATAALAPLRDDDASDEVLTPLLTARSPRTRSAGVTGLRRAGRAEQAWPFLGDRSAFVRACARYVVRQHGGDPAAWYRERCTAPDDLGPAPGAVIGLAECGGAEDAALLRPLLAHPVAGVRAQAVAGLRALDLVDADRLRTLLDDPSPRVVRETALALLPSARHLPVSWLLERTRPERPRHVRVAAFRLLDARGGAVGLRAAVALLEDPDEELRTWAGRSVRRLRLSPDVRRGDPEVDELLARNRHLFDGHDLRLRQGETGVGG